MSNTSIPIRLNKSTANHGDVNEKTIMLFFPSKIFFQNLIRHVGRDPICSDTSLPILIFPNDTTLDNLMATDDGRVSTSMKLHHGDCDQRESDVGAVGPRKVFILLNLKGKVHRRLRTSFPRRTRVVIGLIALKDLGTNAIKIIIRPMITKVWRLHRRFINSNVIIEFHLNSQWLRCGQQCAEGCYHEASALLLPRSPL